MNSDYNLFIYKNKKYNMSEFKESDYFKSDKHIQNAKKASILGISKIKEIKEININVYNLKPKKCKNCNNPLSYKDKHKKFCNSSCSAKFNNKKRILSNETKNKIKNSLNDFFIKKSRCETLNNEKTIIKMCENCHEEFSVTNISNKRRKKNCSDKCSTESKKRNLSKSVQERIKNGKHKGWQSRNILSYPEQFFRKVLKNNNLYKYCDVNYSISKKELGLDEEGNYFLDFYFKDKKIDLEIDGKQHDFRKEHDEKRDTLLKNYGIYVYRIKWKSINSEKGKKYIKDEINKFLIYYNSK